MPLLLEPQSASDAHVLVHHVPAAHVPLAHCASAVHGSPTPIVPVPPLLLPLLPLLPPLLVLQAVAHGVAAHVRRLLAVAFACTHAWVVHVVSAVTQLWSFLQAVNCAQQFVFRHVPHAESPDAAAHALPPPELPAPPSPPPPPKRPPSPPLLPPPLLLPPPPPSVPLTTVVDEQPASGCAKATRSEQAAIGAMIFTRLTSSCPASKRPQDVNANNSQPNARRQSAGPHSGDTPELREISEGTSIR
jgi:hypothetical protein